MVKISQCLLFTWTLIFASMTHALKISTSSQINNTDKIKPDSIWAAQISQSDVVLQFKDQLSTLQFWHYNNTDYNSLTASEKLDLVWHKITEDQTPQPMPWGQFTRTIRQCINTSFCLSSDAMRLQGSNQWQRLRAKVAHTNGAHAKVTIRNVEGHPFTGIFAQPEGAQGLIRLSETGLPFADTDPEFQSGPLAHSIPSFALKFFVSQQQKSVNLFGMVSFEGFSGFNFFQEDFSSSIGDFTDPWLSATIGARLAQRTRHIGHTSNFLAGQYTQDGNKVKWGTRVWPFSMRYEPVAETVSHFTEEYTGPLLDKLTAIPANSHLFNVYGLDAPGGTEYLIGELWTDSEMVTSLWGDETLFFRHQDSTRELNDKPEWASAIPVHQEIPGAYKVEDIIFGQMVPKISKTFDDEETKAAVRASIIEVGCPFKWVFESLYGEGATPESIAANPPPPLPTVV